MPTFTPHGPFVPDELVQSLEDDQVILFCGAGISMDAGLPNFSDLVRQAYTAMGASVPSNKDPIWSWPDRMLGELEQRYPVGEMRRAIVSILNKEPTTLQYHTALLQLAKLKNATGLRLVTTNFDTFFERADNKLRPGIDLHSGPVVPIPRDDRIVSWQSIVHYLENCTTVLND